MQRTGKVPVTVITGFLGAGKTSLVRHLLENANGRRLALIINEFGDLGVDGDILRGCGIETCTEEDVVELTNGCLCCTVADDFIPTLESLLDRADRPDHIVIETSGLALPKPLIKAFRWPEIRSRTTVDGVVTVIDGPAVRAGLFAENPQAVEAQRQADEGLDHDSPLEELFTDQLACADLVVLGKTDLMDAGATDQVRGIVEREIRPAVKALAVSHGRLDPTLVLGLGARVEDHIEARKSVHDDLDGEHDHDDFESFVFDVRAITEPALIAARVSKILAMEGVLRVKGAVEVAGKPARLMIQGVGPRVEHYYDRVWTEGETRAGRLVVIGLTGFDRDAIEAGLKG